MSIDYAFEVHKLLNRKRTTISIIVPAWNEGARLPKVLEILTRFPAITEIVLVNDGSTDNTLEVMKYYEKRNRIIKIVDIQPNKGKTNAVHQGFNASNGEMVCLVDADLEGLKFEYLYKMIYYLLTGEFDMTILDREGDRMGPLGWSQSWVIRFIGGERAMWRKDFANVKSTEFAQYAIEQDINVYYVQNKKKVRTIYCPGLKGEYQWNKHGLINSLKRYAKMMKEYYVHSHISGFYYQVENIVEDRIEPLYKLMDKAPVKKPVVGAILLAGLVSSVATFAWLNIKNNAKKPIRRLSSD